MAQPAIEEVDPIGTVVTVTAELRGLGLSLEQSVFLGYFVSFDDIDEAAAAAHDARGDCWRTSVYGAATGAVVRLSRQGPATLRRLRRDWDYMRRFARRNNGVWEAVAIEELAPDSYWESIALRLTSRRAVRLVPPPLASSTHSAQRSQELGELGEVRG